MDSNRGTESERWREMESNRGTESEREMMRQRVREGDRKIDR